MSKERAMTAAELMAKLEADPEYQRRMTEKEQRRMARQKALDELIAPFLRNLQELGFGGDSIQEIVKAHSPLPQAAVDVLLSALQAISEPRLQESVVRALGASAKPFDGRSLARCFDSTHDEALKWAIVNTIALAHPHSIGDWLAELRKSSYWDKTLRELGFES